MTNSRRHVARILRRACLIVSFALLVLWCLLVDGGALKGGPVARWTLIPMIGGAVIAALVTSPRLTWVGGIASGGVAAVFCSFDGLAGPYAGILGILVGIIAVIVQREWIDSRGHECL